MMSDAELRKLAHYIVLDAREDDALLAKVAKMIEKQGKSRNVNAKTAAAMLGISVRQLRRIKDHFTYVKTGDSQQAGIMFNANTLQEEYGAYINTPRTKCRIKPLRPLVCNG